jgi:glycosyltransferase involved in cell wall biosynthesis
MTKDFTQQPLSFGMPAEGATPRISVVTTSLNQAPFLEQTITSVLSQAYPNLEYIIIDGGSTDGSREIIQKYETRLSYWVSQADEGQSSAINKGFLECTGDLITFLSSDDILLPDALWFAAAAWKENPGCGVIFGGFKFIDENSQLAEAVQPPRLPYPAPLDLSLIPPGEWRLHQVAAFYSATALDAVGRYVRQDMHYVMDRELLFRVARKYPVVLDARPYGAFRRHPQSKTMGHAVEFGEEFGRLYRENPSAMKRDQHKKERNARFFEAKGYLHLAKYDPDRQASWRAFRQTVEIYPRFLIDFGFWRAVLKRIFH